jgi:hypothetical protein
MHDVLVPMHDGNLWDHGLAYVGWIFYLSKFYEVVDTMIILLRGKKGSTLQTYHHAGVMICGWVALRYKSPAILVGIFLNSLVHTLMVRFSSRSRLSSLAANKSCIQVHLLRFSGSCCASFCPDKAHPDNCADHPVLSWLCPRLQLPIHCLRCFSH